MMSDRYASGRDIRDSRDQPRGFINKVESNHVLLLTVSNAVYPITVEVIHKITCRFGNVLRIVIFKKNGVQAMVEFDSIGAAEEAKNALHNCDIYAGCCTLSVEFARTTRLNVQRNNVETGWDFTIEPSFDRPEPKRTALLDAPPMDRNSDFGPQGRKRAYGMDNSAGPDFDQDRYRQPPRLPSFDEPIRGPPRGLFGGPGGEIPAAQARSVLNNVLSQMLPRPMGRHQDQAPPRRFNQYEEPYQEERFGDRGGRFPRQDYARHEDEPMNKRPYGGDSSMGGGIVAMIYGLDDRMNCDRLFNILCLYGNVVKIRFLKTVEGGAMVQMADNASVERAISYLSNEMLFDKKLQVRVSKQAVLQDVQNPYALKDGTPSFKVFATSKNNRFSTPEMASKNRMTGVTESMHFYNSPPGITEEKIRQIFSEAGAPEPETVVVFPSKSERSSTGLIEMKNGEEALIALALVNHTPVQSPASGKFPFIFKLCFAASKSHLKNGRGGDRRGKEEE